MSYTPYTEEWKKEMQKLTKAQIIELAAKVFEENNSLKKLSGISQERDGTIMVREKYSTKFVPLNKLNKP